jgi:hypothetical protein
LKDDKHYKPKKNASTFSFQNAQNAHKEEESKRASVKNSARSSREVVDLELKNELKPLKQRETRN